MRPTTSWRWLWTTWSWIWIWRWTKLKRGVTKSWKSKSRKSNKTEHSKRKQLRSDAKSCRSQQKTSFWPTSRRGRWLIKGGTRWSKRRREQLTKRKSGLWCCRGRMTWATRSAMSWASLIIANAYGNFWGMKGIGRILGLSLTLEMMNSSLNWSKRINLKSKNWDWRKTLSFWTKW